MGSPIGNSTMLLDNVIFRQLTLEITITEVQTIPRIRKLVSPHNGQPAGTVSPPHCSEL